LSDEVVFLDSKENFLIFITSNGHGCLLNFLSDQSIIYLNEPAEHVFKLLFLEDSFLLLLMQNRFERVLKFYLVSLTAKNYLEKTEVGSEIQADLDDILNIDSYYQNLLIHIQGNSKIYKLPSFRLVIEKETMFPYYSRNYFINIDPSGSMESIITITDLATFKSNNFSISHFSEFQIFDSLPGYFLFSHQENLKAFFFESHKFYDVSSIPNSYYLGKSSSVAVFNDEIFILTKKIAKVQVNAKNVSADLYNLVIVWDIYNNILIIDIQGRILQRIFFDLEIITIGANCETRDFYLATRNNIFIYH
jgi:hypothetical protein